MAQPGLNEQVRESLLKDKEKPAPKMVRVTVARGHSIQMPDPDPEHRQIIGWVMNEKGVPTPFYGTPRIEVLENQELDLPEHEVERLRKIGTLVDPNYVVPLPPQGPSIVEQATGQRVQGPNYGEIK